MKNLIEFITESEQISSAALESAVVKSVDAVRSLLIKNGFKCSKIDKYSDTPSYKVRGCEVTSADYAEFKIFKGDIELGKIHYKKYNLMSVIGRTKDILYCMKFVPNYNITLKDNYEFYVIMRDVFKKKYADEIGCELFSDFLKKYDTKNYYS